MRDHDATIFLSHISEEKELAHAIKAYLVEDLALNVDIFVSSDMVSIQAGDKWLEKIDDALKRSDIFLILCSRESLGRPWIHFEAGAGWVKEIPVIPICHSGVGPSQLPVPLNMLQAIDLRTKSASSSLRKRILSSLSLGENTLQAEVIDADAKLLEIQNRYSEERERYEREATLRIVKSSLSLLLVPTILALIYGLTLFASGRDSAGAVLRVSAGIVALPFGTWFRLSKPQVDWIGCILAAVLVATVSGGASLLVYGIRYPHDLPYVLTQYGNILGFYVSMISGFFLGVALGGWLLGFQIGHRPWLAKILLKIFSLPEAERETL